MDYEEIMFAFIQRRIDARFDGLYKAEYVRGRIRVRAFGGERVTAALISFVCDLGAMFLECYHEAGDVYALFVIL